MAQTTELLDALKRELRRQGKTYADAAVQLRLSEASIKRLFATRGFSLQRLDALCEWLGLELADLVGLMQEQRQWVSALTEDQERELVGDTRLLLLTLCLLNRWTLDEVTRTYRISPSEAQRYLFRLDRMGLIELQPGNRVRLLINRDFAWLAGGPIQRFFEGQVQDEFFAGDFSAAGECRLVVNGMLSVRANAEIRRRLERLAADFSALHRDDEKLPNDERHGTTLVLAMRPWEASVFEVLRREPSDKTFR